VAHLPSCRQPRYPRTAPQHHGRNGNGPGGQRRVPFWKGVCSGNLSLSFFLCWDETMAHMPSGGQLPLCSSRIQREAGRGHIHRHKRSPLPKRFFKACLLSSLSWQSWSQHTSVTASWKKLGFLRHKNHSPASLLHCRCQINMAIFTNSSRYQMQVSFLLEEDVNSTSPGIKTFFFKHRTQSQAV